MFQKGDTIVCLGDSLTAFGTWVASLETRFGVKAVNAGIGGQTVLQGLARFDTDVTVHKPQVVIIGFGTNDQVIYDPTVGTQVSPKAFREALSTLVTCPKSLGANVFLLTPCVVDSEAYYSRHPKEWCAPFGGVQAILEHYRDIVREVAETQNVPVIDIGALSAAHKDEVLGTAAHPDFDGVHPIDSGKRLFEKWIGEALAPHFQA